LTTHPSYSKQSKKLTKTKQNTQLKKAKEKLTELKGKRIAVLGLAFKPDTDDMREARSIPIINQLLTEGADVTAYDPVAVSNAKSIFGDKIKYASSAINCLNDTDCCIIVTEWQEFKIEEGTRLEVIETEDGILFKPKKSTWDLAGSGSQFATPEEMKKLLDKLREEDV